MPINRSNPWLIAALAAIVIGAAFFLVRHLSDVGRLVSEADELDPRFVAVGFLISAVAMFNRGLLNRASHRAVGLDAGARAMTRTAAVGFAAQKMVKSAGAAGLAVFVRDGRRRGHAPGTVAAACVLSAIASFVALGVVLAAAIGVLALTGRMTGWWLAASAGFGVYAVAAIGFGVAAVRHRSASVRLWSRGRRVWSRVTRRSAEPTGDAVPEDVFAALDAAWSRPAVLCSLMLHGVLSKLLGALMLVASVASVGVPVTPGTAIIIYATALAASMVTIMPGGVGAVEGSTAAMLVASGASIGAATLAVVAFRCFDLLVPVVGGVVAARGRFPGASESGAEPDESPATLPALAAAV